ncbi:hypothetical protein HWB99_gp098 [Mycobacterium phage DrLupo]|uniref:Uncharacterized protein n=1 Tax=Mycobacterium phage DrLupo TaxID=2499037 RepID=A0A3S9UQS2_9CAUD|nr:hypothetical protein HWB99_gp098 [Mycobacterium phage DrLupo]AZS12634.1 hypothetical protein SEA_DRLUPO_98 [Mycobacterium phage DrLupo]
MTNFITVTTKDVSQFTGKPKLFAINVDRIVTVEPALFEIARGMDAVDTVEGCSIIVFANEAHVLEVDCRDPFDHVMFRIGKAGGIVDVTEVAS